MQEIDFDYLIDYILNLEIDEGIVVEDFIPDNYLLKFKNHVYEIVCTLSVVEYNNYIRHAVDMVLDTPLEPGFMIKDIIEENYKDPFIESIALLVNEHLA